MKRFHLLSITPDWLMCFLTSCSLKTGGWKFRSSILEQWPVPALAPALRGPDGALDSGWGVDSESSYLRSSIWTLMFQRNADFPKGSCPKGDESITRHVPSRVVSSWSLGRSPLLEDPDSRSAWPTFEEYGFGQIISLQVDQFSHHKNKVIDSTILLF